MTSLDNLIERLRERVQDPERRTDRPLSNAQQWLRMSTAEDIIAARERAARDSNEAIQAFTRGEITPEVLRQRLSSVRPSLEIRDRWYDPEPTSVWKIQKAERHLGFALPEVLKTIYLGVADGGFGPEYGLLPISAIVADYTALSSPTASPRWPEAVLPITDSESEQYCIRADGEIVRYDIDCPDEDDSELTLTFIPVAKGLEAWLEKWLDGPSADEVAAVAARAEARLAEAQRERDQRIDAYIEELRKSPEERAKIGLKGEDWEERLRCGLLGRPWPEGR